MKTYVTVVVGAVAPSMYAKRVATGYCADIDLNREEPARYGLTVQDVEGVIESAMGGMDLTATIEG